MMHTSYKQGGLLICTSRPRHVGRTTPRKAVTVGANLLETMIKPITSAGKVCSVVVEGEKSSAAISLLMYPQVADLKQGIAGFYNESSGLWERMWGEHMHHGRFKTSCVWEHCTCVCARVITDNVHRMLHAVLPYHRLLSSG